MLPPSCLVDPPKKEFNFESMKKRFTRCYVQQPAHGTSTREIVWCGPEAEIGGYWREGDGAPLLLTTVQPGCDHPPVLRTSSRLLRHGSSRCQAVSPPRASRHDARSCYYLSPS